MLTQKLESHWVEYQHNKDYHPLATSSPTIEIAAPVGVQVSGSNSHILENSGMPGCHAGLLFPYRGSRLPTITNVWYKWNIVLWLIQLRAQTVMHQTLPHAHKHSSHNHTHLLKTTIVFKCSLFVNTTGWSAASEGGGVEACAAFSHDCQLYHVRSSLIL